ncbi:hypothetical protein D0Z00_002118 [Geotrichum galactomycetum]|uniref:Uncharacterized protein n=1 Tax=Geotrichum galactomycetum TaxID=27317 RepID=A0ACB6V529_9ASCO|nr:hypothetical protein D0Z00_002118 [Geotrichum candidum]
MDTQVSYSRKPTVASASWNMSANSHHFINTPSAAGKPAGDASSPPTVLPASMSAAVSSGVRLDIYHPTLNTGISDIRIQDAVLEYPIVRALIVPECDLEARRRCIGLISNVIKAANPVLHFVLLQQKQNVDVVEHYNILAQFLSTVPTKESLVRFWFMHYMEEVRNEVIKVYGHADKLKPSPAPCNAAATAIAKISLTALYAKIRRSRDVLQDLADRVQGAVCIVFWESWDGIYQELAEIVGDHAMETADKGRIFRASGTAAIYINRRRVERRAEEQRRAREKHLPKEQETTNKHGMDTALLTPPDMMDTFIDYVDDAPKPAAPAVQQHESPNMIQIKNSPIASPAAITEPEDGKADHGHWPFKLLTAPMANKSVELIDTTELEEVMNDKRPASTMVDNTEHSELRKRIRLMEN